MSYENSIAFLGPAGTYCNEAALRFAARLGIDDPDLVECASFDEVFDCVDDGTVRFGVVGKENSLEGPVTATLDNFAFRTDSVILAQGAPGRRGGGAGVEEGGAFQIEGEAAGVFQALQGALVAGVAHGVDGAREQHLVAGLQIGEVRAGQWQGEGDGFRHGVPFGVGR